MLDSFGDLLLQFSQSVDYLEDKDFDEVRDIIEDYAQDVLKITATRFMVAGRDSSSSKERLSPLRHARRGNYRSIPVRNEDDTFSGHCAYSYKLDKRLWIISGDDNPYINHCDKYLDLWSDRTDLPKYRSIGEQSIKTSIIIPAIDLRGDPFGAINFETTELLGPTKIAKNELTRIANALSIAYLVLLNSRTQHKSTEEALKKIRMMQRRSWPKLTKPKIFLASSARADKEVIDTIQGLFEEADYKDKFHLVYWENMNTPGNINTQLLEILGTCRFGICYFSEPSATGKTEYQDNPNVIFEAGMIHGRSNISPTRPVSWIPIREENSEAAAFDFQSERTITVPRDKSGKLITEQFNERLRNIANQLDRNDDERY